MCGFVKPIRTSPTPFSIRTGLIAATALAAVLPLQAAIIYQDNFNFGTSGTPVTLNGRTPTITTGTNTWTSANITGNGSDVGQTGGSGSATAYLPFTPLTGQIYELTALMSNASSVATSFVSLGFNQNAAPTTTTNFAGNSGIGHVALRQTGNLQWWEGPATGGFTTSNVAISGYTAGTFYEFKLLLNTMAANWTMDLFFNGSQVDINGATAGSSHTWATNPTIGSIQISSSAISAQARWNSVTLTAIPEPSFAGLVALSGLLAFRRRRA